MILLLELQLLLLMFLLVIDLDVIIAGPDINWSDTDDVIATIPVGQLADMEKYVVFANGVLDPSSYAANPDGVSTGFEFLVKPMAREDGNE